MAPQVFAHPEARTTKGHFMATPNSTAPEPHPSTDESPHACLNSAVYIGHLVEDPGTGEEVEILEAVPCRRCASAQAEG
jgi:hypothetical protein